MAISMLDIIVNSQTNNIVGFISDEDFIFI
jgi:hypothetical protein